MSSIRPLFTITVLLVVGGYLYWKINEGPTKQRAGTQAASNQIGDGVPPLAATSSTTLDRDTAAPAWPPATPPVATDDAAKSSAPAADAPAANYASATTAAEGDVTKNGFPEVPPIPELPELPSATAVTPPSAPAATAPTPPATTTDVPAATPTGQYGDAAGPNLGPGTPTAVPGLSAPELPMPGGAPLPSGVNPPLMPGAVPPASPDALPADTSTTLPIDVPAASTVAPPIAQQSLPPTAPAAAPPASQTPDRYGLPATSSTVPPESPLGAAAPSPLGAAPTGLPSAQATATIPAGASFAASWPAIQAALDAGDLKQAHQLLSKWHGVEALTPAESEKVEGLLGQLAGTVIYSTEHQLEPARVVKSGETLESIAREYNVPWQLLGKINNVAASDQIRPGQQLKVVRGPFTATVDLHRNELTLEVDGRYAGTFPVAVPPGVTVAEGQWLVDQKTGAALNSVTPAAYPAAPAPADLAIVLRSAASAGGSPTAPTLTITSSAAPAAPGAAATALRVSPQDVADLSDILSIGSRVVVRR